MKFIRLVHIIQRISFNTSSSCVLVAQIAYSKQTNNKNNQQQSTTINKQEIKSKKDKFLLQTFVTISYWILFFFFFFFIFFFFYIWTYRCKCNQQARRRTSCQCRRRRSRRCASSALLSPWSLWLSSSPHKRVLAIFPLPTRRILCTRCISSHF